LAPAVGHYQQDLDAFRQELQRAQTKK